MSDTRTLDEFIRDLGAAFERRAEADRHVLSRGTIEVTEGSPMTTTAPTRRPVYERLRTMKGRGRRVQPMALSTGDVIRVDGLKYRVTAEPERTTTGSVKIPAYSEDNQFEDLYLAVEPTVALLGSIDVGPNPFEPGDWADHKSGTLDPREVAKVQGENICLQIGTLVTPPIPHANYDRIPKES